MHQPILVGPLAFVVAEVSRSRRDPHHGLIVWVSRARAHARVDPDFCLYVIENVSQGDPSRFTLRVLAGERLRGSVVRAVEKRYYQVR